MLAHCRQVGWILTLVLLMVPAWSQVPTNLGITLQYWDFEENTEPWSTMDEQAILGLTSEQENVLAGTSALELHYLLQPAPAEGAGWPKGNVGVQLEGGTPGLAAVALGLKTSYPTCVAVSLQVEGQEPCLVPVFSTGTDWHHIVLSLNELLPPDQTRLPDSPLPTEQISRLVVVDLGPWLMLIGRQLPFIVTPSPGPRRLWIDEVRLVATAPSPEVVSLPDGATEAAIIDSCDRAAFRFIVLGGEQVQPSLEQQAEGGAGHYRINYTLPGGTLFLLLRTMHVGSLAGTANLHFSVRASRPLTLLVSVEESEESNKSRYDTAIEIEPSDDWTRLDIPYDSLTLSDDSTDENGQLDPEQITVLTLADMSALVSLENLETTLWLDDIYATE